ncbi:hypothetical protein N825_31775 [Skermanella stibiiresistens SB22]|uniref:Uncharacterized protein n=1 Tax=Skermanella stibiiresistens SB22 TaxID=1385369 RepID=W9GX32_9PROT|nr:hypothetical protein [Skermanella stibiiresistens]EWY36048.1 hypothetical protein N825_31775 [Skermanella stibiiresistens SB22]
MSADPSGNDPIEWYRVERHPDSDLLVIVFSHVSEKPGRFSFFGTFRDFKVNKLFLNTPRNHWYREGVPGLGDDIDAVAEGLRIIMQEIAPRTVMCVGNSMGAHAALLFGALINADHILAIGPETILNLSGSRSRSFMVGQAPCVHDDLLPLLEQPVADRRISIVIGESDAVDLECARRVAHLPGVTVRTLRSVGHEVPAMLQRFDAWRPLVARFVRDGGLPPLLPLEGHIMSTGDAADALLEGRRLRIAGKREAARARLKHCVTLYPDADVAHDEIGQIEREEGAFAKAEAAHRLALRLAPDRAAYHHHLAMALEAQGRAGEALAAYDQACSQEPGNKFLARCREEARGRLPPSAEATAASIERAAWGAGGVFQKEETPSMSAPSLV